MSAPSVNLSMAASPPPLVVRGPVLAQPVQGFGPESPVDIVVDGGRIMAIEPHAIEPAPIIDEALRLPHARVIDGRHTLAVPGLYNAHTHAAMIALRSAADDMPLMPWLHEKIWPLERRITPEDTYWATRLAALEMIRTGTTFYADMYWAFDENFRAAEDSGLRALIGGAVIDLFDGKTVRPQREFIERLHAERPGQNHPAKSRVSYALAPRAIYTVRKDTLEWVAALSEQHGTLVHMHLAETQTEETECVAAHGLRPVAYAAERGLLSPRLFAAHSVHLDDDEIALYADKGVKALHNPISNLKLASGGPMRYADLRGAGVTVLVGTDGCASNNNLDLYEELKFAALLAKHRETDATALGADEALEMATRRSAEAYGIDGGVLAVGKVADIVLVDRSHHVMFPGHHAAADLVYGGGGRAVKTTICDGRVLMENGVIPDEAEIRAEVRGRLQHITGIPL